MENRDDNIYNSLLAKIRETEDLRQMCEQMMNVPGRFRLQRKILAELQFLRKLSSHPEKLKEEHLRSSNLCHLSAIVRCCSEVSGVAKILEPFNYIEEVQLPEIEAAHKRVVVDVVCDYGGTWVKVVARNPRALLQSSLGAGKFGRRSIVEQVEDMKMCANQNLYMYSCPKIVVWFASGVACNLSVHLEEMGVTVLGTIMDDDDFVGDFPHVNMGSRETETSFDNVGRNNSGTSFPLESESQLSETPLNLLSPSAKENDFFDLNETYENVTFTDLNNVNVDFNLCSIPRDAVLNLDVSTMIAQVSNLTNGFCNFQFQEGILTDQATREREYPVRKVLDLLFFRGYKLICCQTAYDDFTEILSTVAGEQEKVRASEMWADVTVVQDNPSQKTLALQISSKVRDRSKIIFGTGDNLKAITVTANLGFVRAAQSQGMKFVALVHESRALTEQKEKTAFPLVF